VPTFDRETTVQIWSLPGSSMQAPVPLVTCGDFVDATELWMEYRRLDTESPLLKVPNFESRSVWKPDIWVPRLLISDSKVETIEDSADEIEESMCVCKLDIDESKWDERLLRSPSRVDTAEEIAPSVEVSATVTGVDVMKLAPLPWLEPASMLYEPTGTAPTFSETVKLPVPEAEVDTYGSPESIWLFAFRSSQTRMLAPGENPDPVTVTVVPLLKVEVGTLTEGGSAA